jgi:hypothetical protein
MYVGNAILSSTWKMGFPSVLGDVLFVPKLAKFYYQLVSI